MKPLFIWVLMCADALHKVNYPLCSYMDEEAARTDCAWWNGHATDGDKYYLNCLRCWQRGEDITA